MSRLESDKGACSCYEYLGGVIKGMGCSVSCEWRY